MSETQLVSSVLDTLAREPGVVAWRNNSGAIRVRGRMVRYGLGTGSADIVGITIGGRFFALECKVEGGVISDAQIRWRMVVEAHGGFYAIVRSVQEARQAVRAARSRAA